VIPLTFNFKHALIAGAIFVAFSAGWTVNGWRHDAAIKKAAEETIALQKAYDKYAREVVSKNINAKVEIQDRKVSRNEQIKSITDNRVCFANWDSIRMWNESISDKPSMPKNTNRVDDSTRTASITNAEILENINENGARWAECRTKMQSIRELDAKWFGEQNE